MKTNPRIKFFCRSFDLRLYRLSKGLYESLGYPCVRLTDQTADGYFHTMLQDTECDIAINVDEDCFITNPDAVFELVDYAVENNIANIGCPDGGGYVPRRGTGYGKGRHHGGALRVHRHRVAGYVRRRKRRGGPGV